MISGIQERDFWSFCQLYSILTVFADEPTNVISRIGGGRISIPDDQANELDVHYKLLLAKYPDAADLEIMTVITEIDTILARNSLGGESFDKWFWTNAGFERHYDWIQIRNLARAFLLR